MANPLFEALNGNRMSGMLEQFQRFRKEMEGRNPQREAETRQPWEIQQG